MEERLIKRKGEKGEFGSVELLLDTLTTDQREARGKSQERGKKGERMVG